MAITQFPFDTDQPKVRVRLPVGVHVLQLVVEDHAGLRSAPARVTIVVERAGVEIESISPTAGRQGETVSVTVTGKKLATVHRVEFAGGGLMVSKLSATETALRFSLAIAADAAPGLRALTLFTSVDELAGPPSVGFTVERQTLVPTVNSIVPDNGMQGERLRNVLICGQGLLKARDVVFDGGGISVTDVVPGEESVSFTAAIDEKANPGQRRFTLRTFDGLPISSGDTTFLVKEKIPAPKITAIDPHGGRPGTRLPVKVTGVGLGGTRKITFDSPGFKVDEGSLKVGDSEVSFTLDLATASEADTRSLHGFRLTGQDLDVASPPGVTFAVVRFGQLFCCMEPRIAGKGDTFDAVVIGDFWNYQVERVDFFVVDEHGGTTTDGGIEVSTPRNSYDRVEFQVHITDSALFGPHNVSLDYKEATTEGITGCWGPDALTVVKYG